MNELRRAVFRVDASAQIGGGHVMRCLTLADALDRRGWRCDFVVGAESATVVPALAKRSGRVHAVGEAELGSACGLAAFDGANLLVVDHYGLDADFESAARKFASSVLVIEDAPGRPHDCDMLLDQTYGRAPGEYAACLKNAETILLTGTEYALLRQEFAALRRTSLSRTRERVARVLVSFGATDPWGMNAMAAQAAVSAGVEQVHVAVGSANPHLAALHELAGADSRINLHIDADMATLMASADLAIGAAGSTSWERCCLGLPAIVLVMADNQAENARVLKTAGAAETVAVGDENAMERAIARQIDDPVSRHAMARKAGTLCDGLGAERVALALEEPTLAKDGGAVSLRLVSADDALILLDWQRDLDMRRFARDKRIPSETEHLQWFEDKRADPGCVFHILEHRGEPAGFIRLDWLNERDGYEVSIGVAPDHRSSGIARAGLSLTRELLPDERLLAYVRPENVASANLFVAAGYRPDREDWYISDPR